jgi:hypothetical protein
MPQAFTVFVSDAGVPSTGQSAMPATFCSRIVIKTFCCRSSLSLVCAMNTT